MSITKQQIEGALSQVIDLYMDSDLMATKSVKDITHHCRR